MADYSRDVDIGKSDEQMDEEKLLELLLDEIADSGTVVTPEPESED